LDSLGTFLAQQGMNDVEGLESFLNKFVDNPALFTSLTVKERSDLESQMDTAFSLIEQA